MRLRELIYPIKEMSDLLKTNPSIEITFVGTGLCLQLKLRLVWDKVYFREKVFKLEDFETRMDDDGYFKHAIITMEKDYLLRYKNEKDNL